MTGWLAGRGPGGEVERAQQRLLQGAEDHLAVGPRALHTTAWQGRVDRGGTEEHEIHATRRLPKLPSRHVHALHVVPLVRTLTVLYNSSNSV